MSTTPKNAAHTKYLPGATTAGSRWKNLLDQSHEATYRIRRGIEDEMEKVDDTGYLTRLASAPLSERTNTFQDSIGDDPGRLTPENASPALATPFTFYHTLR